MNKIAAIYARVSTTDGSQDYNRQIKELELIIRQHGYTEIEIYAESISGYKKNDERPQLQTMMRKIEENPISYGCVYTSEISRIGRNPSNTRQIIDKLTDVAVPVYIHSLGQFTIDSNGKRNMIMNIILQVLMEYANLEAETFKTRSKSGMLKSVKEGKIGTGISWAYGYKKEKNGMMAIDDNEARAIRIIFEMYSQGNGYRVISNRLIKDGFKTRMSLALGSKKLKSGKSAEKVTWSDNAIKTIITNTTYYGERKYKDVIIAGPPIITKELFDECNKIRLNKDYRNYVTTYTYLLKDMCKCGVCGRNYFAKYKIASYGDKVYVCSSKLTKEGSCGNIGVNISLIESAIYHLIISTDAVLKYINNDKEIKNQFEADIKRLEYQINSNSTVLYKKKNRIRNLFEMRVDGEIDKSTYTNSTEILNEEVKAITESIKTMQEELNIKKKAIKNIDGAKTTKDMIQNARQNRTELQGIFKQIIGKVIINKIDNRTAMANIFISLSGVVLPNTLKLFLDIGGLRKKPPVNRYYAISKVEIEPIYKNGVLLEDIQEIKKEFENKVKFENSLLSNYHWVYLKNEELLTIPVISKLSS